MRKALCLFLITFLLLSLFSCSSQKSSFDGSSVSSITSNSQVSYTSQCDNTDSGINSDISSNRSKEYQQNIKNLEIEINNYKSQIEQLKAELEETKNNLSKESISNSPNKEQSYLNKISKLESQVKNDKNSIKSLESQIIDLKNIIKNLEANKTTPTPPPTTSTPAPPSNPLGSRKNPVPLGTNIKYNGMDTLFNTYIVDLTLTDVIRGSEAWDIIKNANMFNTKPPAGKEYILLKFNIRAIECKDDKIIDINNACFDIMSKDGVMYDDFVSVANITPALTEIYAGASIEGYVYKYVNIGDEPTIVFHNSDEGGLWFLTK